MSKTSTTDKLISLDDLYKLPGHCKVFHWPMDDLKRMSISCELKFPHRRYIFRQIAQEGTANVRIELCHVVKINNHRELNYSIDLVPESSFTMPILVYEKLKTLVSEGYKNELELKFVDSMVPADVLNSFISSTTREFCTELFQGIDLSVLNLDLLAKSSASHFKSTIFKFYQMSNPTAARVAPTADEKERFLSRHLFHDHYPLFFTFAKNIAIICGGRFPDVNNFDKSLIRKLNHKYNNKVLDFTTLRQKTIVKK